METNSHDRAIKQFLSEHIRDHSRVIDVGCGTGWTALHLAQTKAACRIDGVDISELKIHRANSLFLKAKRDHVVHCQQCGAEELTKRFGYALYDFAVSSHSLHHYREPLQALKQIRSTLKPGGHLLLVELEPRYGETIDDCPRYSLPKILFLVQKARLAIQSAREKPPGVFLVRAVKA